MDRVGTRLDNPQIECYIQCNLRPGGPLSLNRTESLYNSR